MITVDPTLFLFLAVGGARCDWSCSYCSASSCILDTPPLLINRHYLHNKFSNCNSYYICYTGWNHNRYLIVYPEADSPYFFHWWWCPHCYDFRSLYNKAHFSFLGHLPSTLETIRAAHSASPLIRHRCCLWGFICKVLHDLHFTLVRITILVLWHCTDFVAGIFVKFRLVSFYFDALDFGGKFWKNCCTRSRLGLLSKGSVKNIRKVRIFYLHQR